MQNWFVYILECSDGSFYTGITTDLERRLKEHNQDKKGAKYTRVRRPVKLVYHQACKNRSEAGQSEYQIRKLPRSKKMKLIGGFINGNDL